MFVTMCLRSLRLIWRPGLSPVVNRNGRNDGGQHYQGLYKEYMNRDCIES